MSYEYDYLKYIYVGNGAYRINRPTSNKINYSYGPLRL